MKKTVRNISLSLLAVLVVASYSFAGAFASGDYTFDSDTAIETTHGANISVQPSPGVQLDYDADTTGSSCHVAAANMRGTKSYGGTSDFEGMMVSIQDFSGDEAEFPTMPDEGTAWDATEWMVLGDPGADVPSS